jgi:hypothetical protein
MCIHGLPRPRKLTFLRGTIMRRIDTRQGDQNYETSHQISTLAAEMMPSVVTPELLQEPKRHREYPLPSSSRGPTAPPAAHRVMVT